MQFAELLPFLQMGGGVTMAAYLMWWITNRLNKQLESLDSRMRELVGLQKDFIAYIKGRESKD